MTPRFDIAVVGGGHAGIEAALAAARMGARTVLVTHAADEIGRMPCNPAVGGLGKGHLVRELDVLGGEMGRAIDETGIQFRILNRKKGPAVQAPRAQADKHRYQERMRDIVVQQTGLTVIEGDVVDIAVVGGEGGRRRENAELVLGERIAAGDRRRSTGIRLGDGREIAAARVVLSTGTFLRGLMHVGSRQTRGGREGAASAEGLSAALARHGLELVRLKTGTPPRLRADSVDFVRLQEQPGDENPRPFSFRTRRFAPEQIVCHLAHTNSRTHAIIRANLARSPLYGGVIAGQGPRYCPSIEDKVVRFADKERHLIFLEPEGRDTDEIYVNGLSTSLPADVQEAVVRSIPGLEKASITRWGYAVEYDSVPSYHVDRCLESKAISGLYLAGQILGTSGYEEAAVQGFVAGVNAALSLAGRDRFVLGREHAYIGVLVDDLVTKDIHEPYRMFTSRSEHRLRLRCDNAVSRLAGPARRLGLLDSVDIAVLECRSRLVRRAVETLESSILGSGDARAFAGDWLRRPGVGLADLLEAATAKADGNGGRSGRHGSRQGAENCLTNITSNINILKNISNNIFFSEEARFEIENEVKYAGYIRKQDKMLSRQAHLENLACPAEMDYGSIQALSYEAREKLQRLRPETLGQAGRIDGVRAGDLAVLSVHLQRIRMHQEHSADAAAQRGCK